MKSLFLLFLTLLFLAGCKSKKSKPDVAAADFFPVRSYLQGQLAQLETSLDAFYKVETINGHSDTVSIRNKDVRIYGADFANLPDISSPDIKNDYNIDRLYDDMLEAFVFTFTTKEDHPVKREDVVLEPEMNKQGKNEIKSVFVQMDELKKDTVIQKNLFWEAAKKFKIVAITRAAHQPSQTKTIQVFWNGFTNK